MSLSLTLWATSLQATERYASYHAVLDDQSPLFLIYADTTDVQRIIVAPHEESNTFVVQCTFLTGSIAQGCMVVLKSEFDSITINLTRNSWCAADTLEVTLPLSNYSEVLGYDIESDGSIGTLAVHGIILKNGGSTAPCMLSGLSPNPSKSIGCFGSKEQVIIELFI